MGGFSNKILLCTGDLRQLTPVVKSRAVDEQLRSSIVFSAIWPNFHVHRLRVNFRQMADPAYSAFAEAIGEGRDGSQYTPANNYCSKVDLSAMITHRFTPATLDGALEWIYPQLFDQREGRMDPLQRAAAMAT